MATVFLFSCCLVSDGTQVEEALGEKVNTATTVSVLNVCVCYILLCKQLTGHLWTESVVEMA